MLKAGVHFGHQKNKWHPKMAPFIFTDRNNVHIIDLEKTQIKLGEALEFIKDYVAAGKTFLIVATKEQARPIVKKISEENNIPYIAEKWIGGLLTNFDEIYKTSFKKFKKMKNLIETGEIIKYTKKEQIRIAKELEKMGRSLSSLEKMERRPDAVIIVDIKREKTALNEALRTGIKIVAVCDTNVNPDKIDYIIPANDDATKSLELLLGLIGEAIKEGHAAIPAQPAAVAAKKTKEEPQRKERVTKVFSE